MRACLAGPPSPDIPGCPVPAMVSMMPVAPLMRRMTVPCASGNTMLPAGSREADTGADQDFLSGSAGTNGSAGHGVEDSLGREGRKKEKRKEKKEGAPGHAKGLVYTR